MGCLKALWSQSFPKRQLSAKDQPSVLFTTPLLYRLDLTHPYMNTDTLERYHPRDFLEQLEQVLGKQVEFGSYVASVRPTFAPNFAYEAITLTAPIHTEGRHLGDYTITHYPKETIVSYSGVHPLHEQSSIRVCCINGGPIMSRQDRWKDICFFGKIPKDPSISTSKFSEQPRK